MSQATTIKEIDGRVFQVAVEAICAAIDDFNKKTDLLELDDVNTIPVFINILLMYLRDSVPEEDMIEFMAGLFSQFTSHIQRN